jgi:nickel-dependent lactate racemase
MATISLKYGHDGLAVDLPDSPDYLGVLEPRHQPALPDPEGAVRDSLSSPITARPLAKVALGRTNAVIVVSKNTRPVPNNLLLPPILSPLEAAGIPSPAITTSIATGIDRPNEGDELEDLVGADTVQRFLVLNHRSRHEDEMVHAGEISGGTPVFVNRIYAAADLKILTGFIEPHMWDGYSGGRRSIPPGISSVKTLKHMHGPEMVANPNAAYGKLEGNPFHEAELQIMERVVADFIVNETLNTEKRVTGYTVATP